MLKRTHIYTGGFSLVEVVIVAGIVGVLGIAVASFGTNVFSLNAVVGNGLAAQQDARRVVKTIASEIRAASPSSAGSYPIEVASTSEIVFYSDMDGDGLKEKIRYYVSGLILKKDVIEPSGTPPSYTGSPATSDIINDVRNGTTSIFTYYDTNYDGTTAPLSFPVNIPNIRLVKINLAIDRDPYRSPVPVYINTQVSIRNLKDNL